MDRNKAVQLLFQYAISRTSMPMILNINLKKFYVNGIANIFKMVISIKNLLKEQNILKKNKKKSMDSLHLTV